VTFSFVCLLLLHSFVESNVFSFLLGTFVTLRKAAIVAVKCACRRQVCLSSSSAPVVVKCACRRQVCLSPSSVPVAVKCACRRQVCLSSSSVPVVVKCACPAVRNEQFGSHWTKFRKTSCGCVSLPLCAVWKFLYEITRYSMKWVFEVWDVSPLHVVIVLVLFCSLSEDRPLFDKANSYWME